MRTFEPKPRMQLTELEFLRSVLSTDTDIGTQGDVIVFTVNNNKNDILALEELRENFRYKFAETPKHYDFPTVDIYWMVKK